MAKTILTSRDLKLLQERIAAIHEESEKKWGKMTVSEMLCHLSDQLRMALGEIPCRDKSTFFSPTILKFMAVNLVNAPPEKVQTVYELDQRKGGTKPVSFEKDKQVLLDKLDHFTQLPANFQFYPHGVFGHLKRAEWGKLIYKHIDHHLRHFSS